MKGSNLVALAALPLLGAASSGFPSEGVDVNFAVVSDRHVEVMCRGISSGGWLILNWHCLADLRTAQAQGKRVKISRRGSEVELPVETNAQPLPAALKVAESAGLDFTVIASPLPAAAALPATPVAVQPGDRIELHQDGAIAATCIVSKICGSRIHYRQCSAKPVRGWSGSSVWLSGNSPQLIGIHKDGPEYSNSGSARSLTTILGRSSVLAASDSDFAKDFARNHRYRFVHAVTPPEHCDQAAAAVKVQPFITRGKRTIVGMTRLGDRDIITADINSGQICRFRWPSAAAVKCWANSDPLNIRVNSVQVFGDELIALAKANDGNDADNGAVRFVRLERGQPAVTDVGEVIAPIGSAHGLAEVGGDLVVIGSHGLCIVAGGTVPRDCTRPEDRDGDWRVTGVLPLNSAAFVAVGSDHEGNLAFPVCKWFERIDARWELVSRCARSPALMEIARVMKANGRELRFKAPVALGERLLVFASDGGAYQIAQNRSPKPVSIRGIYGSDGRLEDAVRDARSVGNDHVALASSDGSFRLVKLVGAPDSVILQAYDIGSPRYSAFDLAIWTTQLIAGEDWALVRGQDGSVYSATWSRLP